MGEINVNVRNMIQVKIEQEVNHNNFDQYISQIQNFLQSS